VVFMVQAQEIWDAVAKLLSEGFGSGSQGFLFLKSTKAQGIRDGVLIVDVPNRFVRDWLNEYCLDIIEGAVRHVSGKDIKVMFNVSEHFAKAMEEEIRDEEAQRSEVYQSLQDEGVSDEPERETELNPRYTFDTFVVGSCNKLAHAAAWAVAESPASVYNPLFIYGGVGLGKTHLLHAIGNHIKGKNRNAKVVYVTSEKFMNELINSIRFDRQESFRSRYRNVDVLLIDDIEFIAGKEATQVEFFHTFNSLYEARKQIVITSDSPPRNIPELEERLRSRFEMGLITDIQPPDTETRLAILRKKAEAEGVVLSNDVMLFIAGWARSSIRELEGYLKRVIAYSSLKKSPITLELAREALRDILPGSNSSRITVDAIQKVVAQYYNITQADMRSKRRTEAVAFPRQVAMYLSRELTDHSLPEIGEMFGGRDHATVIHACQKIQRLIESDRSFAHTIEELKRLIKK
jgi:chromosomal replication initiator protein